ncbi:hypothetical protein BS78_K198700 [Paspalum vaginatum]|uniref:Uncharacterized protein n=1 Tax=Paspalum vaginatum TaxID=158149 RepID=A0A9W7XBD9_9POAL|nr:hypothetical protein BS78_K198700 [Paspalum vaginatum]
MAMASQLAAAALLLLAVLSAAQAGARPGSGVGAGAGAGGAQDHHGYPEQGGAVHQVPAAAAVDAGAEQITNQLKGKPSGGGGLTVLGAARQRLLRAARGHAQLPLRPAERRRWCSSTSSPRRFPAAQLETVMQPAAHAGRRHGARQVPAQPHRRRRQRQRLHRGRSTPRSTPCRSTPGTGSSCTKSARCCCRGRSTARPSPRRRPRRPRARRRRRQRRTRWRTRRWLRPRRGNTTASDARGGTPGAGPASCVAVAVAAAIWWGM